MSTEHFVSTVYSWRGLAAAIGGSTGVLNVTLGAKFDSDFDAHINIEKHSQIAIEGNMGR